MSDCWMQSISGRAIDFDDVRPEHIEIEDIALGLSRINRYLGHTPVPLTVAEHSIRVAHVVRHVTNDVELTLRALLHDAAEAYVGDVTAPVKRYIRRQTYALDVLELRVQRAILERFGLRHLRSEGMTLDEWERIEATIKHADLRLLATEYRDLVGEGSRPWNLTHEPLPRRHAIPLPAERAEQAFLEHFHALWSPVSL
jgi:5'-deoxynucleotidase YfbR-like HD superfamily hydrolase